MGGEAGDGDGTPVQCKKKRESEAQSCEIQPEGENGVGGEVGSALRLSLPVTYYFFILNS